MSTKTKKPQSGTFVGVRKGASGVHKGSANGTALQGKTISCRLKGERFQEKRNSRSNA